MAKLNQIVAIEKTAKAQANDGITLGYHIIQKPELFAGIARSYEPIDEDGERFPPESTLVQNGAEKLLADVGFIWTRLLDVTATKDWGNTSARADVKVDGQVIISDAPVTYLIWLEKQLVDLRTMVSKLPILDPALEWTWNEASATYATPPTKTHKSKKVPRNHVLAEATAQHPAQVQVYQEDVLVGNWTTVRFSGALPRARQNEMIRRVEALQAAVKFAREEANSIEVVDQKVGGGIFSYLLAP